MNAKEIALTMRRLALLGGAETLKHFRSEGVTVDRKADDSPVTVADRAADEVIVSGLAAAHPDIAIVTEERAESHAQPAAERFFLIDPLDGTKEFISGDGAYTVNIALDRRRRGDRSGRRLRPGDGAACFGRPNLDLCVEERGKIEVAEVGATRHCRVRRC